MVVRQTQSKWQDALDELTERLLPLTDYVKVGNSYVFEEPPKCSRIGISFDGVSYVADNGVVVRLNLPEQLYVLGGMRKRFGIKVRHGSLRENLEAAYSKEAAGYKRNVLALYWVYTGEVIRKFGDTHEVSKAIDANFVVIEQSASILLKRHGKPVETIGSKTKIIPEITLGPVQQTEIPTKFGYYSRISGIIPMNSELGSRTKESKGYFGGIHFDEQGLSAVGCFWGSVVQGLDAKGAGGYAGRPLGRDGGGVRGVWTDENPKK